MKLVNSALVIALAFPLVSFADMRADAPGKLNNPILWSRCIKASEVKIPIEDVIAYNKIGLEMGCIGEREFSRNGRGWSRRVGWLLALYGR